MHQLTFKLVDDHIDWKRAIILQALTFYNDLYKMSSLVIQDSLLAL